LPFDALLLTLAAAVVHAGWNMLLAASDDSHSASAVAVLIGALLFAPAAVLTWRLTSAALPYVAVSATLEVLYLVLLSSGYSRAAMSFVYPIARGSGPVFVLAISGLALGVGISGPEVGGVLLVALGIVLVHGLRKSGSVADLALALSVGACIAAYTLVDKHGITHGSPLSYLELVFALEAVAYVGGSWRIRGGPALRAALTPRTAVVGVGFFGSYLLVLAALRLASAPSVAAVRECSVVIATVALAVMGRERITLERFAGAAAVVAGIALISVG
jgi:drug/metabolite transporter (DMT)-like permease